MQHVDYQNIAVHYKSLHFTTLFTSFPPFLANLFRSSRKWRWSPESRVRSRLAITSSPPIWNRIDYDPDGTRYDNENEKCILKKPISDLIMLLLIISLVHFCALLSLLFRRELRRFSTDVAAIN